MASKDSQIIKNGEEFQIDLANTAYNSKQPNEWFLVKADSTTLTKENIIDTLHLDIEGHVKYKTKNYKKGENKLVFISRLGKPPMDNELSRTITFFVK